MNFLSLKSAQCWKWAFCGECTCYFNGSKARTKHGEKFFHYAFTQHVAPLSFPLNSKVRHLKVLHDIQRVHMNTRVQQLLLVNKRLLHSTRQPWVKVIRLWMNDIRKRSFLNSSLKRCWHRSEWHSWGFIPIDDQRNEKRF